ncbi:MAG: hypothetical protein IKQ29_02525 [Bacilli bacterium]|nr:hypothetical protein [Bacilli bacterium]
MANVKKKATAKKASTKKSTSKSKGTKVTKVNDKKRKDLSLKEKSKVRVVQSQNDYMKPVICLIIIFLILLVGYFIFTHTDKGKELIENIKNKETITKDEKKFKEEYELLNSSNVVTVSIKENNNVIYTSLDGVLKILDNGSGIILFGNKDDTNTRLVISKIIDNIGDKDLYYLDVLANGEDIRAKYEFVDFKIKKVKDGVEGYDKLLEYLDEYLEEYQIVRANGKKTSAEVKHLDIPLLIKVKDGKVINAVSSVGSIADYINLIDKD